MSASEKEIITLGFGNYSTLVAAQWANSTSHYDVQHRTLYASRHLSAVYGGSVAGGGKRVRVPRLVLLDAPHAVRLEELSEVVEKEMENGAGGMKDEETAGRNLFGRQEEQELVPGDGAYASDAKRKEVASRVAQRAPWEWREKTGFDAEEESESESEMDDAEQQDDSDAEEDRSRQRSAAHRRRRGNRQAPSRHRDAAYQIYTRYIDHHSDEEEEEEDEEESVEKKEGKDQPEAFTAEGCKRRLFDSRDYNVPWWHYIATGLPRDAVTTLRPPQQADVVNNIAATHSFGYGLAHLKPSSPEMEQVLDSLRRQVEDADAMQGLQFFVDADSMFGGAAHHALEAFWEDVGPKMPAVVVANYQALPSFLTNPEAQQHVPFAAQRRQERHLNRLLCTSALSQPTGAVFIPLEMEHWGDFFTCGGATSSSSSSRASSPASLPWLEDDRATAQLVAALTDTALYGARDAGAGGDADDTLSSRRTANSSEGQTAASAGGGASGPAYSLREWARTVRPTNSLRVQAMMGCLPLRLREAGERKGKDLWQFLEQTPLLGPSSSKRTAQLLSGSGQEQHRSEETTAHQEGGRLAGDFCPLTHAMPFSPLEEKGRVLGHAVSLRGAGVLSSAIYPEREAMLRYAIPLRTGTYLPLLTRPNYPISNTFPLSLLLHPATGPTPSSNSGVSPLDEEKMRRNLDGVDVGAHVVSTYTSSGMLQQIIGDAKRILSPQYHCSLQHKHHSLYEMTSDDWNEVMEDVLQVFDDYHHDVPQEVSDDDEG